MSKEDTISADELADEFFAQVRNEISTLTPEQVLLYGYVAAMREFPAYLEFSRQEPEFGDAELATAIASEIRTYFLGREVSSLEDHVKLLDERYVPDTEDFGSECMALEAALALIYLYKYSTNRKPDHIFEIFRGIIECILMLDDAPQVMEALAAEQSKRRQQYELIRLENGASEKLLDRCLAINQDLS